MEPRIEPAETLVDGPDATVDLLSEHPFLGLSASRFAPGAGPTPPPHVHAGHAEAFLVLDGALRFGLDDGEVVVGAGTWVVVPPGVVHTFRVEGEARFLDLHAPSSGYGAFVRALSSAASEDELARARAAFDQQGPPEAGGADPAAVVAARAGGLDGETIADRPGRRVTLLADTDRLTVTEFALGPGQPGPDLHVHRDHADAFLVVEGELELTLESGVLPAPAGTFVLVPPGVVHTFAQAGPGTARFFNLHVPACGFGEFLRGRNPGFDQHYLSGSGAHPSGVVARRLPTA